MVLAGSKLVGSNPSNGRVPFDYYATPFETTRALLDVEEFKGEDVLEPCIGQGHISRVISEYYPNANIDGIDIIERDLIENNTNVTFTEADFLQLNTDKKYDTIITNPPYSLAQKFVEKSMNMLKDNGKLAMFLKIQFLESKSRKPMFKEYPPKTIYVFSERQNPMRNGLSINPATGKKWSNTMCFAWFIWEQNDVNNPIIKWI